MGENEKKRERGEGRVIGMQGEQQKWEEGRWKRNGHGGREGERNKNARERNRNVTDKWELEIDDWGRGI